MKKRALSSFSAFLIIIVCLIFVACQNSAKEIQNEEESVLSGQVNHSAVESSIADSSLTKTDTIYGFYPEDMSVYGDKTVLHFGYLNFIFSTNTEIQETLDSIWRNWNEYLVSRGSPYVMQLVTCANGTIYDPGRMGQIEEELGFTFDIVSYQRNHFSAEELSECFEALEAYFDNELQEAYESMPEKFWDLALIDSHVYDISANSQSMQSFQSFGYYWDAASELSEDIRETLEEKDTIEESLQYLTDHIEQITAGVQWRLPDGSWTLYQRADLVRLAFQEWGVDSYFDYMAPLIGIDYVGGTDEIICILDSPTFNRVTDFFLELEKTGSYIQNSLGSGLRVDSTLQREAREHSVSVENRIYYNMEYNLDMLNVSVRKDTQYLTYVLDFINRVITETDYAKQFYGVEQFPEDWDWVSGRYRILHYSDLAEYDETALFRDYIQYATPIPTAEFVLDDSAIQEEIEAIEKYLLPQEEKLGTYDRLTNSAEWKQWNEIREQMRRELDELGLQTVIDEANRQYREWKSKQ